MTRKPAHVKVVQGLGNPAPRWTIARWVLLGGLLAYAVVMQSRIFDRCIHDDAFISFRDARNLARGEGLVTNAGGRVEGFERLTPRLRAETCPDLGRRLALLPASTLIAEAYAPDTSCWSVAACLPASKRRRFASITPAPRDAKRRSM